MEWRFVRKDSTFLSTNMYWLKRREIQKVQTLAVEFNIEVRNG